MQLKSRVIVCISDKVGPSMKMRAGISVQKPVLVGCGFFVATPHQVMPQKASPGFTTCRRAFLVTFIRFHHTTGPSKKVEKNKV